MATTRRWFKYNGNDTIIQQENTSNWTISTFLPAGCTTSGSLICAIYAVYSPNQYDNNPAPLSNNLLSYIVDSNASGVAKPSGTGQKRYVYVKSA